MSRTTAHKPPRLFRDEDYHYFIPWKKVRRLFNSKDNSSARRDRRRPRHASIDEEDVALMNAIAKYKGDIFARYRWW